MDDNHNSVTVTPVVVVCIKEVQNTFKPPISKSKAQRMIDLLRDANPKPKHHIYTMTEFYKYFGIL